MKAEDCVLNKKYRSSVNTIARNCWYEIIKKKKIKLHAGFDCGTVIYNQILFIRMSDIVY